VLVEVLVDAGAAGARLTGAGFGGCVVAICVAADARRVHADATTRYEAATGIAPYGFAAKAVDGALPGLLG